MFHYGIGYDDRVRVLRMEAGGAAVDAYWCVLERIYGEERPFDRDPAAVDFKALRLTLMASAEEVSSWLDAMVAVGLFEQDGSMLSSERSDEAIGEYRGRAEAAREAGRKGGRPRKRPPAEAPAGPAPAPRADTPAAPEKGEPLAPVPETQGFPENNPPVFNSETPGFSGKQPPGF